VENSAPGVNVPEKKPEQIEREMAVTRESLTGKVAALETQVKGNIEAVASTVSTVKDAIESAPAAVTSAVDAVKGVMAAAPEAVTATVKQTMDAVKESVRDTVAKMDLQGCVRRNPWAALGTTTMAGFLTGYLLFGGRSRSASVGGSRSAGFVPQAAAAPTGEPGFLNGIFGDVFGSLGKELREVADRAFSTAIDSLKQNVGTVVPQLVDQAVHRVAEPVSSAINGSTATTPSTPRMMDGSGV